MERRTRILLSIYAGFVTYCLMVFFFGRTGVFATSELRDFRARLEANLSQLEKTNAHLADHFDALRSSPEAIRLEARQLGFLEPNERVLQVSSYHPATSSFTVGSLVIKKKYPATPDSTSRIVGVGVAVAAFILLTLIARRRDGPHTG